jgi:parvulin-like peptidyl-prolyl isomerase
VGVFIIAAALIIVGAGWYVSQYRPLHQIILKVNDTEFNMDYYVKALRYYGEGQSSYYLYTLADQVLSIIEEDELIRQEAVKLDITVSQDEVDKELKNRNPPLSRDYQGFVGAELLVDKLEAGYFEEQVPLYAEQRHIMVMLLESESQATEVRARIEAGEDFASLASELSLENSSKEESGDLGWHPEGVLTILSGNSLIDDYAFSSEVGVLSPPIYDEERFKSVGYWLAKVLEKREKQEQASVLGILLSSEEEALEIRDRLEAGEDFAPLAEEFSQHQSKDDGGDLGWMTSGDAGPAFDEFVFNPDIELGTVSEPIFDDTIVAEGGYWLIKVTERKEKPEEANIQVILLGSKEEALAVRARLEAGEDFATVAQEVSQHESGKDGGKITNVTPDEMNQALSEFVFDPEVGLETVSEPIRDDTALTQGGYWLVKVVDKDDNKQIEDSDRELLKADIFSKWVEALKNDPENKIESYLDSEKKTWAVDRAVSSWE